MKLSVQQVLISYSAVVSTTLAVVLLMGAKPHRGQTFDEIQAHRINIVEPDGTLRMVISDRDRLPGDTGRLRPTVHALTAQPTDA